MKTFAAIMMAFCLLFPITACGLDAIETYPSDNYAPGSGQTNDSIIQSLADLDGYYTDTFVPGEISEINIEIDEEDWADLCANAMNESYYQVDITVNGTTVTDVGFRTKGASSLRSVASSDSDRYGFKIKFDEYVNDQTLNGLDMLVLNGNFADPSYMREYLAYTASAYLDCSTPFLSYTKLSINGEYFGLYLSVEAYKDSFVERITGGNKGAILYEADTEDCTLQSSDDAAGFQVHVGEDDGNANIHKLIEALISASADNTDDLESLLDIDSVLKAMAVNAVTGNYDSYNGSKAHNYYLLYSDGQFEYIAWDFNMAFGGFSEDGGSSVSVDVASPFFKVDSSMRPLMEKLLEIENYNARYFSYVEDLCTFFSDFEDKITTIANFIRDDVEADPTAFYSTEQFESNISFSGSDLSQITQLRTRDIQTHDSKTGDPAFRTGNDNEMMDNALNMQTVSIMDYIKQRLEFITD